MLFLADESCDGAIVRAVREVGHDVCAVRDAMRGATDRSVLDAALHERRVLLTEDKDFGELVFAVDAPAIGVLLLRYPPVARPRLMLRLIDLLTNRPTELIGSFVVLGPARTRIRRMPSRIRHDN